MPAPKQYRCVPIADCRDELAKMGERRPAVLIGSFVSVYPPTSLPFGMAVCSGLWDFIFGQDWPEWLKGDFGRLPFESLMECYPDCAAVPRIVRDLFGSDTANPVHQAFAGALQSGTLSSIITTNYDRALEACQNDASRFFTITTEADFYAFRQAKLPACYKIHGTAAEGLEETLVCNLGREGRLQGWKRELLLSLLADRTLIVVGYSGRDFDICPELADADIPLELVWLQRNRRPPQANAVRALDRRKGTLVIGDLLDFVSALLGSPITAASPTRQSWDPRPHFDSRLVPQWQRRILDWMACATLAHRPAVAGPPDALATYHRHATMASNTGRYRDAAQALERAAGLPYLERQQRLQCEIQAAATWFIYGRYRKAWIQLRAVERQLGPLDAPGQELVLAAMELRLVMYMRCAQIAELLNADWLLRRIRDLSRPLYIAARTAGEGSGAWGKIAALRQNAERIGIAGDAELPLPAAQGYASLGFVSMDVITKRDWLRSGSITKLKERVGRACIRKSEQYGWDHEAWKFHWILLCHGCERDRVAHFAGWWTHFWKTQYPPLGRLFQLLNNLPHPHSGGSE